MNYCVGMLLDAGLVLMADSRTNAGVDNISTFRKITILERPGERVFVLMTAGNLSLAQSVISMLREALETPEGHSNLMNVPNMFEAARSVGDAARTSTAKPSQCKGQNGQVHGNARSGAVAGGGLMRLFSSKQIRFGKSALAHLRRALVQPACRACNRPSCKALATSQAAARA